MNLYIALLSFFCFVTFLLGITYSMDLVISYSKKIKRKRLRKLVVEGRKCNHKWRVHTSGYKQCKMCRKIKNT